MSSLSRHPAKPHNPTDQQGTSANRRRLRGSYISGGGVRQCRFCRNNMYQFAAAQSQCTWKVTLMGHSVASVDVGEFQFAQPPAMPLQLPLIRGFSLKGPNGTPIRTPLYIQSMGVTIAASITAVVAFLVIIFALPVFFWVRRRRRRLLAPSTPAANDEQPSALKPLTDRAPGPISGQEIVASSLPGTTNSMPRPYNPDDPGSYPPYRGNLPPRTYHSIQSPSSSSGRNLYTVAAAPNSQGQVPGYSGPARTRTLKPMVVTVL